VIDVECPAECETGEKNRCHKFKIYHIPRRFNDLNDTHLPYHLLKIPLKFDDDDRVIIVDDDWIMNEHMTF
jgi:hypothetical protein